MRRVAIRPPTPLPLSSKRTDIPASRSLVAQSKPEMPAPIIKTSVAFKFLRFLSDTRANVDRVNH